MLTFNKWDVIIIKSLQYIDKFRKIILKNVKKVVDKMELTWYTNKVADETVTNRTLIIEQWNNLERFY